MSREICKFDQMSLCVNNYRGRDYSKPNSCVDCEDCIFNPKNEGLKINSKDQDKVIKDILQELVKEKIKRIKDGNKKEIRSS